MLITKTLTDEQIKKLHATGDAYVCSSRGEGWCIPAFESLAYGNKLVTTTWGGMGEFALLPSEEGDEPYDPNFSAAFVGSAACRENVYPVDYWLQPLVGQTHADPELYTGHDLIAEASVVSMMEQMNKAFDNRETKPAPDLMDFDHSVVGPAMLQVINEVVAAKTQEPVNV